MDREKAALIKKSKQRGKTERMRAMVDKRVEIYSENKQSIDDTITRLVEAICLVEPVDRETMCRIIHRVMKSLFYNRPSKKVVQFLDDLSVYPPEVLFESMSSYSMYLTTTVNKKKESVNYFLGFVRKNFFEYKKQKDTENRVNINEEMPDDF